MSFRRLFIALFSFAVSQGTELGEKENWIAKLRSDLLSNYNPRARPVKNHSENTSIQIGFSLNNLDVNDHTQTMSVVTFLAIMWKDDFLQWNSELYGGIESVHFDKAEIWMPDIALYNSARGGSIAPESSLPVLSYSNGRVMWVPPFTAEVPCPLDLSSWPSDTHTCTFRFGSWSHHGEQLDLKLTGTSQQSISLNNYEKNNRWKILNYTSKKQSTKYADETYFHIDFEITVQRLAASHASYVSQTTFAIMLIIMASYLLPLHYYMSRFLLHLFSLSILTMCDFALMLSLPASGGSIPFVVKYYSGAIALTTLSLISNIVLATAMAGSFGANGSPECVRKKLSSISCRNSITNSPNEVAYRNLQEDLVEIPQGNSHSDSTGTEQRDYDQSEPQALDQNSFDRKQARSQGLYRLINFILFCMFSLAFVIDYIIMRATINY